MNARKLAQTNLDPEYACRLLVWKMLFGDRNQLLCDRELVHGGNRLRRAKAEGKVTMHRHHAQKGAIK